MPIDTSLTFWIAPGASVMLCDTRGYPLEVAGTRVDGNLIGTDPSGLQDRGNGAGLHLRIGESGERRVLAVDSIILCAGQEPQRELYGALQAAGCSVHLIGGADVAAELDAKRAINQGTRLAATI